MANNFLQWNPGGANIESDATYASDTQRSGGAGSGSIFASALANKLFYQLALFVTAFATMLTNKGYAPNDGSSSFGTALATLVAVLNNVITNADLQNSGTPYSGGLVATPTISDNSHAIANTAFVKEQGYVISPAVNAQLVQTGTDTASSNFGSVTFPTAFSATPVVVATGGPSNPGSCNIQSVSASGFTYSTSSSTGEIQWIAIGKK